LKRVTSYVERGIIDGCFGYYKTVAREQFAYFLDVPLSTMILKLYVLKGHDFQFKDITDIYNKRIGVLREQFVSRDFDAAKDEDKISVLYADDYKMMIRQLFHGRVDCIIGVTEGLENNIKKLGLSEQIISLTQPISLNNTWILISKKSGAAKKMEVYGKMNRALNDMARENLLHKIAQKYGYKSLVVMGHDAEKK
jgi:ABC-type amino acid transport substrate-binding protein